MDIKAKIEEIVNKVKSDKNLEDKLKSDPAGTIQELAGVDLPEDQLNAIVTGVQAKLGADKSGGIVDKIKGLF